MYLMRFLGLVIVYPDPATLTQLYSILTNKHLRDSSSGTMRLARVREKKDHSLQPSLASGWF